MDDIEAIKQLKARYFRTMDTKDWSAMRDQFCDDVVMDSTDSGGDIMTGADNTILDVMAEVTVTLHFQDNSPDLTANLITAPVPIEEQIATGSSAGTGVLFLFGRYDQLTATSSTGTLTGATATLNGVDYDVGIVEVDREQGVLLKLRKRKLPWPV